MQIKVEVPLKERSFPTGKLTLLASNWSAGQKLTFGGQELRVQELTVESALFGVGASISREFAPRGTKNCPDRVAS